VSFIDNNIFKPFLSYLPLEEPILIPGLGLLNDPILDPGLGLPDPILEPVLGPPHGRDPILDPVLGLPDPILDPVLGRPIPILEPNLILPRPIRPEVSLTMDRRTIKNTTIFRSTIIVRT